MTTSSPTARSTIAPGAYIGKSAQRSGVADFEGANRLLYKAAQIKPDILLIQANLANNFGNLQRDEEALVHIRRVVEMSEEGNRDASMGADDFALAMRQARQSLAQSLGDYAAARAELARIEAAPDNGGSWEAARQNDLSVCGALHDRACFAATLEAFGATSVSTVMLSRAANIQLADVNFEDWDDVVARSQFVVPALRSIPAGAFFIARVENPLLALALAKRGDIPAALRLAADTPAECVTCLRVRARLAALRGDWRGADDLMRKAAQAAPSMPFAFGRLGPDPAGERRFRRRDREIRDRARQGSAFRRSAGDVGRGADPPQRSDLAVEKFVAAAAFAPNWGRLHLKWGEALLWSGDRDGARRQFARAAALFLTPGERAELAGLRHG